MDCNYGCQVIILKNPIGHRDAECIKGERKWGGGNHSIIHYRRSGAALKILQWVP